jgi:zinc transporter ZupT
MRLFAGCGLFLGFSAYFAVFVWGAVFQPHFQASFLLVLGLMASNLLTKLNVEGRNLFHYFL